MVRGSPGIEAGGMHSMALRIGRRSIPGQIYLVTFTTAFRRPHFQAAAVASDAVRMLAAADAWQATQLLAWVLMPDHWHGLLELGEGDELSRQIGSIKGGSARRLGRLHPELGPVWANGFHDRALRHDNEVRAAARYLVLNPVRAGLVRAVGEYPYWDAVWVGGARG